MYSVLHTSRLCKKDKKQNPGLEPTYPNSVRTIHYYHFATQKCCELVGFV